MAPPMPQPPLASTPAHQPPKTGPAGGVAPSVGSAGTSAYAARAAAKPPSPEDEDDNIFALVGLTTDPISPRPAVAAPVRRPQPVRAGLPSAAAPGDSGSSLTPVAAGGVSGGKFTASRLLEDPVGTSKKSAWGSGDLMAAESPAPSTPAPAAAKRTAARGSLLQQNSPASRDDMDPFDRLLDDDDDF